MPIPTMYNLSLPVLELLGDGESHHSSALADHLAQRFNLTEVEINERIQSGQTRLGNRVDWARWVLKDAGLVENPRSGFSRITEVGRQALNARPSKIDKAFLRQFKALQSGQETNTTDSEEKTTGEVNEDTPEENLKAAYDSIRSRLADEILEIAKKCSPSFFEWLVVDVLVGMGYGGSREEAGKAVGGSGDGGIDGIINEDRLGLEVIYIQAKRWEGTVGRPEIQKFAGALAGRKAGKGVFITTSTFTNDAWEFVKMLNTRIILIDGRRLAEFMIDYNVGVTTEAVYELKRIDTTYFEDQ